MGEKTQRRWKIMLSWETFITIAVIYLLFEDDLKNVWMVIQKKIRS